MLSHHDRTELAKIERALEFSDPHLAAVLRDGRPQLPHAVKTAVLLALEAIAGTLLVVGLVVGDPGVTLCGILMLTGTIFAHVSRPRL